MHVFSTSFIKTLSILSLLTLFFSCKKISNFKQSVANHEYSTFFWFNYQGNDDTFKSFSKSDDSYINPILTGFYPDPSICYANGKFYLINSSFSYFPGIPIFESTDLVNWKQLGHVITRKEQADFSGLKVSKGMFAPTIRYHYDTFYVICTNVEASGNFIVTAKNPAGPWSDPILLPEVEGIDPDLFFDDDGKVYITHNGVPPNNISKHEGHRAIYMFEYDLENKKVIGESTLLVNGGTSMDIKPVWVEAPHIFKKDGYYYLICAQGGTGNNHSEVVFRSKSVSGPYVSYENNPILTQRHLDANRPNEISSTGHADFIELPNGDWWTVFLGCRPYEGDLYNTGRETFLMPLAWENDWPKVVGGKTPITVLHKKPNLPVSQEATTPTTGNFVFHDDFNEDTLDFKWNFIRTPLEAWYKLDGNNLLIKPRTESIHTKTNYSFIGRRQQHLQFEASTKLSYTVTDTLKTAGLVAFQNEDFYLLIGKRLNKDGNVEVYLEKNAGPVDASKPSIIEKKELNENTEDLFLKVEGDKRFYNFYYKTQENDPWILLGNTIDASILSTNKAGGFVGTYLGMYTSLNHF
ncbi:glycoside hydrolase family 43 protein [Thalassobellus sediminis]|uniref:glycoside hydrolase family 43 protein n=1 Tax=Thalassobellus sediminis TaxID=3367753 RepID=UPI0037B22F3C